MSSISREEVQALLGDQIEIVRFAPAVRSIGALREDVVEVADVVYRVPARQSKLSLLHPPQWWSAVVYRHGQRVGPGLRFWGRPKHLSDLEVLSLVEAEENPPKPSAKVRRQYRLTQARLLPGAGTTPAEKEEARRKIRQWEARYPELRRPGEALERRMAAERRRREESARARAQTERYNVLRKAASRSLRAAFSRAWYQFDQDKKEGFIGEAVALWLAGPGPARGVVTVLPPERPGARPQTVIEDLRTTAQDVTKAKPSATLLLSEFREIAVEVRRSARAEEAEVQFGEFVGDEPSAEFVDPVAEAAREAASATKVGLIQQALRELEKEPGGEAKAALVRLHLGESVVPGQPGKLTGTLPFSHLTGTRKTKGKLRQGIARHPRRPGRECPTCKRIARFVRLPGLDERQVGHLVDEVVYIRLRELVEQSKG